MKKSLFLACLLASSVAFAGWGTVDGQRNWYFAGQSDAADAAVTTPNDYANVMIYSYQDEQGATAHIGTLTVTDAVETITVGTPTVSWGTGRTDFAVTIDAMVLTTTSKLSSISAEKAKGDSVTVLATVTKDEAAHIAHVDGPITGKAWLTNLGNTTTLDFGETGSLDVGSEIRSGAFKGFQMNFTATVTLNPDVALSTRQLVSADDAWYLAGANNSGNADSIFNYATATLSAADGTALVKCDFASNLNAAWTVGGELLNLGQVGAPVYRFVAGKDGVWVQYTPEPATATLSLLALAGLAARRRRK